MKKTVIITALILVLLFISLSACTEKKEIPDTTVAVQTSAAVTTSNPDDPIDPGSLAFEKNSESTGYVVSGIGSYTGTDIVIPSVYEGLPVVAIGRQSFRNCKNIMSVVMPDSITAVEAEAFSGCTSLKSIKLSLNLESIGNMAFMECSSLSELIMPDKLASIGMGAFGNCFSIKTIRFSRDIEKIDRDAFRVLEKVTVSEENKKYYSVDNCVIERDTGVLVLGTKNSVIPTDGSVTAIGARAFKSCTGLESISIPISIKTIGGGAFASCASLKSITLPQSVETLGDAAFGYCRALESVTIEGNITKIGRETFVSCEALKHITLPKTLISIERRAFAGCYFLASVDLPDTLGCIDDGAFERCVRLEAIVIPSGVYELGELIFDGCKALKRVDVRSQELGIFPKRVFGDCNAIEEVRISKAIVALDDMSLLKSEVLKDVYFDGTLEEWNAVITASEWQVTDFIFTVHLGDGGIIEPTKN